MSTNANKVTQLTVKALCANVKRLLRLSGSSAKVRWTSHGVMRVGRTDINFKTFVASPDSKLGQPPLVLAPSKLQQISRDIVTLLADAPLSQVRQSIFPRIEDENIKRKCSPDQFVCRQLPGRQIVTYDLDTKTAIRRVSVDDLRRWKLTKEALHELALRNLQRTSRTVMLNSMAPLLRPHAKIVRVSRLYAPALILLPSVRHQLLRLLRGSFYVAFPTLHSFVAGVAKCKEDKSNFAVTVMMLSKTYPPPLGSYRVTRRGIRYLGA